MLREDQINHLEKLLANGSLTNSEFEIIMRAFTKPITTLSSETFDSPETNNKRKADEYGHEEIGPIIKKSKNFDILTPATCIVAKYTPLTLSKVEDDEGIYIRHPMLKYKHINFGVVPDEVSNEISPVIYSDCGLVYDCMIKMVFLFF